MPWKLDESRSIWPQLKEIIKRDIISGKYTPGGAFPTVRELAEEAGVNRNTMQRAMSELEEDGLLITNRTSGRVVTDDAGLIEKTKRELAEINTKEFVQRMKALGFESESIEIILKETLEKEKGV